MNKTGKMLLAAVMSLTLASACSTQNNNTDAGAFDPANIKTVADAFAVEAGTTEWSQSENRFVYAIDKDGECYRFFVELPEETAEAVDQLSIMDEDHDEKLYNLISALPIARTEYLNETAMNQEELGKLVGKTGGDLLDAGWIVWFSDLNTMEYNFHFGPHSYNVAFDGKVDNFDVDPEEAIRTMKIKSVTFAGLGDILAE
ncbi:MAG: hypothetical protein E7185_08450 [Erysipelotrichaceae bacterium]|nr:hypothetical protein [Erysipelotrichaceae bacterium]